MANNTRPTEAKVRSIDADLWKLIDKQRIEMTKKRKGEKVSQNEAMLKLLRLGAACECY